MRLRISSCAAIRILLSIVIVSAAPAVSDAAAPASPGAKSNRLSGEKSPYLLQHAGNPIWWYPWGEEALEAAKRENKPVFLSIGYSTCYWCHFMEKDSFEKQDVADILNANFIAIKVDREERPDVDNIYMTALVSMTGAGGWPMSMFLTPDAKPFFGASTIPHDRFISILGQIIDVWKTDEPQVRRAAAGIAGSLAGYLNPRSSPADVGDAAFKAFLEDAKNGFDRKHAGFGGGNKFPRPHALSLLLRVHRRSGDTDALLMATRTLKAMARGGMHDLLAGGFHRYSVDAAWEVPHFEKMLYDNAGLAAAYIDAYRATGDSEFAAVARMTLDWVLAEMTHPDGGFYSAQDAGEFGEEGDYYAWTHGELKKLLSTAEFRLIEETFRISTRGNFEGKRNVFHVPSALPMPDPANPVYASAHAKLTEARAKRTRPRLDDKVLADWNGLMIAAMSRGYQALGDIRYLDAARKSAGFIKKTMRNRKGELLHRWRDGHAAKRALLDDYAFMIHALIELYQSDFNKGWIEWAIDLQSAQDKLFWDEPGGAYYMDDARDPTLIVRSKDFEDMAMPSGNSMAALNLLRLADLTADEPRRARALRLISTAASIIRRAPNAVAQMLIAVDYSLDRSREIAIIGPAAHPTTKSMLAALRRAFLPNIVIAQSDGKSPAGRLTILENKPPTPGNKPAAYVCERGACGLPATTAAILLDQVSTFKPLNW